VTWLLGSWCIHPILVLLLVTEPRADTPLRKTRGNSHKPTERPGKRAKIRTPTEKSDAVRVTVVVKKVVRQESAGRPAR